MGSHENTGTTLFSGALTSQTMDLAIVINTVVFQYSELDFLMLMFDLLGGGVILLLALLSATTESKNQVKSRFCKQKIIS